jgi:hypothetical protein
MSEVDEELVKRLAQSRQLVGELDEVLIDQNNKVIDGLHRLKAYPGWKTRVVNADHKQALILRLHRNFRRTVSKEETKHLLNELALTLKSEGTPDEQIASEIVKLSPYSEAYTLSLLPKKYKQPKAVKAGEKAAKATYKVLYQENEKPTAEQKPTEKKTPQKYLCPVCGAALALVGELLVPYHEAIKK